MIEVFLLLTLHPHAREAEQRQAEGFYRSASWHAYHEGWKREAPIVEWHGIWPRTQGLEGYVHSYFPDRDPSISILRMTDFGDGSCGYYRFGYFESDVAWGEIKYAIDLDEIEWKEKQRKR